MGQCFSSSASKRDAAPPAAQQLGNHLPQNGGLSDRAVFPAAAAQQGTGGMQVAVSQARCPAHLAGGLGAAATSASPLLVQQTPTGDTLVALFEPLGEAGAAVAAFCRSRAYVTFQECSAHHPGSPLDALRSTFRQLDAALERLPHAASSGASGVMLLLERAAGSGGGQRCYCANVGAAACLLARIAGSFNCKRPEAHFLTREHTTSNREELVRLQRRVPGEATPPPSARGAPTSGGSQGATPPPPAATRALGCLDAKRRAGGVSGGGAPLLTCEAHAADHGLLPAECHLVLGSAPFWRLVGPSDCALRAHFHDKFAQQEMHRAAAEAAAAGQGGAAPASPTLLHAANAAEHLVHWALEKATWRLDRCLRQQQQQASAGAVDQPEGSAGGAMGRRALPPSSVADLLALPLRRSPAAAASFAAAVLAEEEAAEEPAAVEEGGSVQGGGEQQQQAATMPLEQQREQHELSRGEVMGGEVAVVVVTLRSQDKSMDGGMQDVLMAIRAAAATAESAQGGVGGGEGGAEAYMHSITRRRWGQIRMLVDFHKAHRREVLRRWWEAEEALFRRGRIAAGGGGQVGGSSSTAAAAASGRAIQRSLSPSKPHAGAAAKGEPVAGRRSAASSPVKKVPAGAGPAARGAAAVASKRSAAAGPAATGAGARGGGGGIGGIKAVRPTAAAAGAGQQQRRDKAAPLPAFR